MKSLSSIAALVAEALAQPVSTWPSYTPATTSLALFNEGAFAFLNHPDPPKDYPKQLVAASTVAINGVQTATVPVHLYPDLEALLPIVYHECFHVFQANGRFYFPESFDFFKVLAYYPELNAQHRGLCTAESAVFHHPALTALQKAETLAQLAQKRFDILSQHEGLLAFEKSTERREGTAAYVEQIARQKLFGRPPELLTEQFGWSRNYAVGAAVCWLLDALGLQWHARVEAGESPTEILLAEFGERSGDLEWLKLDERVVFEETAVWQQQQAIEASLAPLIQNGIHIHLPPKGQIMRAFSPQTILSLGNGQLIHTQSLMLQLENGKIEAQNCWVLEDYEQKVVVLPRFPLQLNGYHLQGRTESISLSLEQVTQTGKNQFHIHPKQ